MKTKTPPMETPVASLKPMERDQAQMADWRSLYRVGGVAAILTIVCIILAVPIYTLWPPPGGLQPTSSTVIDCFTIFQHNWLLGLLDLDLMMLVSIVLGVPISLALYVILRRVSPSLMALALALGLVGMAAYFVANPAFSMLTLSNHYAIAASDAQRSSLVVAGQAILATYQGTGFDTYYVLGALSTFLIATVMFRSTLFSKGTASVGMAAGILMIVPATAGTIGLYLSLISLVPLVIWYVLVAQRLFMLARESGQ